MKSEHKYSNVACNMYKSMSSIYVCAFIFDSYTLKHKFRWKFLPYLNCYRKATYKDEHMQYNHVICFAGKLLSKSEKINQYYLIN